MILTLNLSSSTSIANSPPYSPSNPQPIDNAINIPLNITLHWTGGDPDSDPVTYTVFFGTHYPPQKLMENLTSPSYTIDMFSYSTRYNWMILARDNHHAVSTSPIWSFTTIPNPDQPPAPPSNPQPSNGQHDINSTPTLSWTCSNPNNQTILYDIYLDAWDQTPDVLLSNHQTSTTYTITAPGFYNKTTYYWKIIAWVSETYLIGPTWTFTTQPEPNTPPKAPHDPRPTNNSSNQTSTMNLAWNDSDPDGDPLTYDIFFGTTNPPPKQESNYTQATYEPGILLLDTLYYWKIIAWDTHSASSPGPLWLFTTTNQPNRPPNKPMNPSPPNAATNQPTTVQLKTLVIDVDNDLLTVRFYNAANNTIIGETTATSGTQATTTWTGLNTHTTYTWYVIVNDSILSNQSDTWTFTTQQTTNQPPTANAGGPYTGMVNQSLTLDGRASHDNDENLTSIIQYDWRFSINDTWHINLGPQPIHTYTTPGIYTIELLVTDDEGEQATDTATATITQSAITITPTPAHLSTNISVHTSLQWNVNNPFNTQVSYDLYFGPLSSPPLIKKNQTQTSYVPPPLQYNTRYYWSVFAYDTQGHISQNTTWTFTTQQSTEQGSNDHPPTIPQVTINNVFNTKKGYLQYKDELVQLSITSTDPDDDDIQYHVSWGDGTSDQSDFLSNDTTYTITHSWPTLGNFEISVYAEDVKSTLSNSYTFFLQIIPEGIYIDYMKVYKGYLIDFNGDGVYDIYMDNNTNQISALQKVEIPQEKISVYLIDVDFNGTYDIDYNPYIQEKRIRPVENTTYDNKTAYKLDVIGKPWWDIFGSDGFDYIYIPDTKEVIKIENQSLIPGSNNIIENPFFYIFLAGLGIIIFELFLVFSMRGIDALSNEKKQKNTKP